MPFVEFSSSLRESSNSSLNFSSWTTFLLELTGLTGDFLGGSSRILLISSSSIWMSSKSSLSLLKFWGMSFWRSLVGMGLEGNALKLFLVFLGSNNFSCSFGVYFWGELCFDEWLAWLVSGRFSSFANSSTRSLKVGRLLESSTNCPKNETEFVFWRIASFAGSFCFWFP